MMVICPRCEAKNKIAEGAKREDVLCSKCYGPLSEEQSEFIAKADAEAKKVSDSFKR